MPNHALFTLTVPASAAISACHFITPQGAHSVAAAHALGVARSRAGEGDLVPVDVLGTAMITCAVDIALGDPLASNAAGQAIVAVTPAVTLARALDSAKAGQTVLALLIPN